jgi:ABC-type dipeptide/oligopeptide/nickel transport system permease component
VTQYITRRILWLFFVLFVISLVTFMLMRAAPGGPFAREKPLPEATIRILNEKYNLDAPLAEQYLTYVGDIVFPRIGQAGRPPNTAQDYLINIPLPSLFGENRALQWINFGPTFTSRSKSVNDIFRENMPISFQLGLAALVVSVAIGLPLGIIAALRRNTAVDYTAMGIALVGVSFSVIVTAPVLQYFFGVQLRVVPVSGWGTVPHMILPAFTLGIFNAAIVARLTRASLLQVLGEDYVRTARAKGLPEGVVITKHALKNSLIPVITILGPIFAAVVTGSFVVENAFGIPGMGRYFVTSITSRDYPVIMGTILLYAFILVICNLVVDIAYAWIDPRIRFD